MIRYSSIVLTLLLSVWLGNLRAQSFSERIKLGLSGGLNVQSVNSTNSQSILLGNPANTGKTYQSTFNNRGIQLGLMLLVDVIKPIRLGSELRYLSTKYSYQTQYAWQGNQNFEYQLEFIHQSRGIEWPYFIELYRCFGRVEPFVRMGGYTVFQFAAQTQVNITENYLDFPNTTPLTQTENLSTNESIAPRYSGLSASVGVRYLLGGVSLGLELAYRKPLSPQHTLDTRYASNSLLSGYYDSSDDYSLNHFQLNLQLLVPFTPGEISFSSGGGKRGVVPCPAYKF